MTARLSLTEIMVRDKRIYFGRFLILAATVAVNTGFFAAVLALRQANEAVLGASTKVQQGSDAPEVTPADSISLSDSSFDQLSSALPDIAVVAALFISAFFIYAIFQLLTPQANRTMALLRTVGASPAQVFWQTLQQAFWVGLIGSAFGIGVGAGLIGLYAGIFDARENFQFGPHMVLDAEVIAWSVGVGLLATLIAVVAPAFKTIRISPIRALRISEGTDFSLPRTRIMTGTVLLVCALAFISMEAEGLVWQNGPFLTLGTVLLLFSLIALSPALCALPASFLSIPLRFFSRLSAHLAIKNVFRHTYRTAALSAIFLVGLALVSALAVLTASVGLPFGVDRDGIPEGNLGQETAAADHILSLLYPLLWFSFFVVTFCIFAAFFLSSSERTQEVGLLRGVGMAPFKVIVMVVFEVVFTSMLTGPVGIVSGIGLAATLQIRFDVAEMVTPWSQLGCLLLGTFVLAALAVVIPIARSTRMPILQAINEA